MSLSDDVFKADRGLWTVPVWIEVRTDAKLLRTKLMLKYRRKTDKSHGDVHTQNPLIR